MRRTRERTNSLLVAEAYYRATHAPFNVDAELACALMRSNGGRPGGVLRRTPQACIAIVADSAFGSHVPGSIPGLIAWFNPNDVTVSGGAFVSAPNEAPGQQANPWVIEAHAVGPAWSATAMNGTPGITFVGMPRERVITGLVPPTLGVTLHDSTAAFTIIEAVIPGASLAGMYVSSFLTGDPNAGIVMEGNSTSTFVARFDNVGGSDGTVGSAAPLTPQFITGTYDPTTQLMTIRRNGVPLHTAHASLGGNMSNQAGFILGGQTFEEDTMFGDLHASGTLGHVLIYNRALTALELASAEAFVKRASNI